MFSFVKLTIPGTGSKGQKASILLKYTSTVVAHASNLRRRRQQGHHKYEAWLCYWDRLSHSIKERRKENLFLMRKFSTVITATRLWFKLHKPVGEELMQPQPSLGDSGYWQFWAALVTFLNGAITGKCNALIKSFHPYSGKLPSSDLVGHTHHKVGDLWRGASTEEGNGEWNKLIIIIHMNETVKWS